MALTHNYKTQSSSTSGTLSDIGNKVRNVAEIVGAVKGLYDVGKVLYHGARTVAPYISTATGFL